jgi:hypothetical protein
MKPALSPVCCALSWQLYISSILMSLIIVAVYIYPSFCDKLFALSFSALFSGLRLFSVVNFCDCELYIAYFHILSQLIHNGT